MLQEVVIQCVAILIGNYAGHLCEERPNCYCIPDA